MGLGKTAQSIAVIAWLRQYAGVRAPVLVVAPLTTLGHWAREIKTWVGLVRLTGCSMQRQRMLTECRQPRSRMRCRWLARTRFLCSDARMHAVAAAAAAAVRTWWCTLAPPPTGSSFVRPSFSTPRTRASTRCARPQQRLLFFAGDAAACSRGLQHAMQPCRLPAWLSLLPSLCATPLALPHPGLAGAGPPLPRAAVVVRDHPQGSRGAQAHPL